MYVTVMLWGPVVYTSRRNIAPCINKKAQRPLNAILGPLSPPRLTRALAQTRRLLFSSPHSNKAVFIWVFHLVVFLVDSEFISGDT